MTDNPVRISITNRCPDLPLPSRATEGSSGWDLRAAVEEKTILGPGERRLIPTGVAVSIPPGWEGEVRPRSGLAIRHGIAVVNAPGTIDSDYRGEIQVILINLGSEPFVIDRGDRIAQIIFGRVDLVALELVESLPETGRGEGGFGSSGRH